MGKILVMGGSTFVSSSLAQYLIQRGYTVDLLTRGIKEIKYSGYNQHIVCDRKNREDLKKHLKNEQYEFIFDITAYSKEDVEILLDSVAIDSLHKYIFCSSGAVYKPSDVAVAESYEKGKNIHWGQYGLDKKSAEDYIICSGINYIIFRPTYIYGEENNLYREGYFFERIKDKKVVPMPYGKNIRTQFIYIEDLIKTFESAMHSKNNSGIYNVTNSDIISWKDFIETCGLVIKEKPMIKEVVSDKYEVRTYFPFRDVTYILDIEALKRDGLYIPNTSLRDGLEKTYKWYIKNNIKLVDNRMGKIEEIVKEKF